MDTKIFGHRGAAGTHPENTMISFQQAKKVGADGIELDVQLSSDGVPVVIHDEKVDRTTDGSGFVKDKTMEELKQLNAVFKFKQFDFCPIPTLQEVLEWASQTTLLINIELKNSVIAYEGLEEKVVELVKLYKVEKQTIFSSFNHYSISKLHRIAPHIEKAILYSEGLFEPWNYAHVVGAQSLHPNKGVATKAIVKAAGSKGIQVRPYTVNDERTMKKMFAMNVSGFFTDYPEKALQIREKIESCPLK
ncbi:glycerophosphodiester phosphodiesterase [Sutcliffiella sp. NC1]|uniref:glycerophosphodiester phosphodiesterase n=1 Tax=Sutcliffiella sp. NC1 TaxID=3004096 RepID=UPI0022DE6A48|nr:glycerophosphodiester phosphodiesterase [Sutcliffiella sp. NC1]WBL13673.1 glycerophosphodiester phosphodiesterase [Sutcliffiella sp. NC1]